MSIKIKDVIKGIDESKQKIAVKKALSGFLKARYLSRDGLDPQARITYDRSTVTEDIIIEWINEIDREIQTLENTLKATLEEDVNE